MRPALDSVKQQHPSKQPPAVAMYAGSPRPPRARRRRQRRGMALYIYVASVSLIVSMLGLASLTALRLDRRRGDLDNDAQAARQNALAAVELAFSHIRSNPNWRTAFTHGVETSPLAFARGTISFVLSDPTDTSLSDDPLDPVEIRRIGRVGEAVWIHRMRLRAVPTYTPLMVASSPGSLLTTTEKLSKSRWLGQYFTPSLPAAATDWQLTHAEIYFRRTNSVDYTAKLYLPNGSGLPGTLIESVAIPGGSTPETWSYFRINFASNSGLAPSQPLCLGLESQESNDSIEMLIETGLLISSAGHRTEGVFDKGWGNKYTSEGLRSRIYGQYLTVGMERDEGSWQRASL